MSDQALLRRGPKGARPVVLVHGAWHGAWCWEGNFLDFFAEAGFDTFAPDLRGHGSLADGRSMLKMRIRHYADDIEAVIASLDQTPIVIGHSLGGFVVQHLMARGVDMRGVGLLAATPPTGALGAALKAARRQPWKFLKSNLKLSLYPLVENPKAAASLFLDGDLGDRDGQDFARKLGDESFLAFLDMLAFGLPKPPAKPYSIAVIGGARDALFSERSQCRMARKLNADICEILDAPHNVMMSKLWRDSAELYLSWMRNLK